MMYWENELFEQIIDDSYIILKNHSTHPEMNDIWDVLSHWSNEVNRVKHNILGEMRDI